MARTSKVLLCLASALLFQLAFPPFNLLWAVFFCLVPWLWMLRHCSRRESFWYSYLMGFMIVLGQMSFVQPLVARWTGSFLLSLVPWLLCGFLGAFYFAFGGLLSRSALLRHWWWAPPLIWAGIEVFRSFIPGLAFPWFILATPLWKEPAIIQIAFLGTIYLVSGWVVLVNLVFCEIIRKAPVERWRRAAICAGLTLVLSLAWYSRPLTGRQVSILVGQPGFDMAFGDPQLESAEMGRRVNTLVDRAVAADAQLLVLPEGVSRGTTFPPQPPFRTPPEVPMLFGGRRGPEPSYQTAFGHYDDTWLFADKTRLVVFGEYVPGREFLPFLSSFKLPSGDMRPAEKVSSVPMPGVRVGPLICFEGLFWDVAHKQAQNGAQLLTIMAIDDWYIGTIAPDQLKTGAAWRAVETGLPLVRSASLGYTLAVDAKGRITGEVPLGSLQSLLTSATIQDQPPRNPIRPAFPWTLGAFPFAFYFWLVGLRIARKG